MDMKLNVDSEQVLVLLFFAVSGAMFAESFSFGSTAGLFPRLTAGVVLVGSFLLLVQNWLPPWLRSFVAEPSSLINTDQSFSEEFDEREEQAASGMVERELNRPIEPSMFTALAVGLYVSSSFLFGMIWMSPLFAAAYSRWFDQSWLVTAFLAALSFAMAFAFMTVLNLPLDEGQLITIPLFMGV